MIILRNGASVTPIRVPSVISFPQFLEDRRSRQHQEHILSSGDHRRLSHSVGWIIKNLVMAMDMFYAGSLDLGGISINVKHSVTVGTQASARLTQCVRISST